MLRRRFLSIPTVALGGALAGCGGGSDSTGEVGDLYEGVMTRGVPPSTRGYPGFQPRRESADGLTIDRDVAIRLREGVTIHADIYRAEGAAGPQPAILLWSAYGKHTRWPPFPFLPPVSRHTLYECPDPVYWCPRGYTIVAVDPRGICGSEGNVTLFSPQEGNDLHDAIEWIAAQPWCSGKVGMAGASYFAIVQWIAGATRPPHLAALLPYDGLCDPYRDVAFHGGIRNDQFISTWSPSVRASLNLTEDWSIATRLHPLLDAYWESKQPAIERIEVPTYLVASWTDHAIHTRGSLAAYRRLQTPMKWLEVHGRNKWARMYSPTSVARQVAFFDRFLRGVANEVDSWPPVRIEVRESLNVGVERLESAWPLEATQYRRLYLDASHAALRPAPVVDESTVAYEATAVDAEAIFSSTFTQDTELTGYFKLKLWVSAVGSDDMDLFVAVQKVDKAGQVVNFPFHTMFVDGQVAHGWQRVSHRELDAERSTPYQPVHTHKREQRLLAGEIVPVEIEIWPSSTLFRAGEQIRLIIQGTDIQRYPGAPGAPGHPDTRNAGTHVIHTGGRYDSHLLVPVIPPSDRPPAARRVRA